MERLNHSDDLTPEEQAIENMMDASRGASMKGNISKFMQIAQMMNHERPITHIRETPKVGRNEPCPCGSGKKNKNCCKK